MTFLQLLEAIGAKAVGAIATIVALWGVARFIFEPHVVKVVQRVVKSEFDARAEKEKAAVKEKEELSRRIAAVEVRMGKIEVETNRTSEAVTRIDEAMVRLTSAFEKVSETVQGVAVSVARIEGTMERRREQRAD